MLLKLYNVLTKTAEQRRHTSDTERMQEAMFQEFEDLFEQGDGKVLAMWSLCGRKSDDDDYLNAVLVDCLM